MWLPAVVGNGYEPLNDILDSGISITGVAVLVIAKIVAAAGYSPVREQAQPDRWLGERRAA